MAPHQARDREKRDPTAPIRVVIVDDSAIVRKLLSDGLRSEPGIEVVGTAADPFAARDLIVRVEPDVITLDIEMPRMDGLSFLRKIMAHRPMPVIIISSLTQQGSATSIEALRAGAIDVIPKPGGPYSIGQITDRLVERILGIRDWMPRATLATEPHAPINVSFAHVRPGTGLIAIGASTGGPQAIEALLTRLPKACPPILIAQHMPEHFTRTYAERLDKLCAMRVVEASDRQVVEAGTAYVAPGDRHMTVERNGIVLMLRMNEDAPVHHQRPAVDVLFHSIARLQAVRVVALLLTGMGQDGADGMVALRRNGAETIAEDEHSCVVFGMPRAAIERGGACHVASLLRMPQLMADCFTKLQEPRARMMAALHASR
jgi:two-component system, chemotaxis family, protein-glutamate methylesterase/glutaminase